METNLMESADTNVKARIRNPEIAKSTTLVIHSVLVLRWGTIIPSQRGFLTGSCGES
jgi:hypothetical protein